MKPCPRCGSTSEAAIWPYLKGGTGANGEKLEWRRCSHCEALFSDLTLPTAQGNRGYPHNDHKPSQD